MSLPVSQVKKLLFVICVKNLNCDINLSISSSLKYCTMNSIILNDLVTNNNKFHDRFKEIKII